MRREKILKLFIERFGNKVDVSTLKDTHIVQLLLADDLKKINLSYKQIRIKYNVTDREARYIKFKVIRNITLP